MCVAVEVRRTHLLRPWHRQARASLQWLHLWLHSLVISKAREWSCPGLRPAHTFGAVTADQWVDDLESERAERHRGFESLRFRAPTSTSTDMVITYRFSMDGAGLHFWWHSSHEMARLAGCPREGRRVR